MRRPLSATIVFLALTACASRATSPAQICQFEYNEKVEREVVQALKIKFGATYQFFNYERPTITRTGDRVEVALLPLKKIKGHTILYESVFVVAVNACSSKVVESFEAKY